MASPRPIHRRTIVAGIASLAACLALGSGFDARLPVYSAPMREAGKIMQRGLQLVAARRHALGVPVDPAVDPNRTGLIGPEDSELMTTVGDLEAKRTTTNPNMAGLIVHLLNQAGVSRGQTIGVACSGSFPALMVAALAAARSIGVRPVVILSLGASSFGATSAQFNLLDIYDELARGGICSEPPAAVSLGGEKDVGLDFETELRDKLFRRVEASGVAFIQEPELQANVARRIAVYEEASGGEIAALINCGGSYASLGTSAAVLDLAPGLVTGVAAAPRGQRGLVHEMASRGIPVIHLLHVKGLTLRYGLPWDPVPLPEPEAFPVPGSSSANGALFWLVSIGYLSLLALLVAWPGARPRDTADNDFR